MGLPPHLTSLDRVLRDQNRELVRCIHEPTHPPSCFDCRLRQESSSCSVITNQGMSRSYCWGCYRWREARMWTFDDRTREQLEAIAA